MNTHTKTEGNRDHDAQEMFPAMDARHFQIFLRTNFLLINLLIDKLGAFKQSNFSAMYLNSFYQNQMLWGFWLQPAMFLGIF